MSDPGRRTVAWRRAGLLALAGILVLVAARSAQLGVSGLVVELAQQEVTRWTSSPRRQSMREVSRIADYYADSLAYAPGNPWALEGLGALDLMRMRLSTVPGEALAYTKDAKLRFREALRQRPTSPFLWANLALAKLYLDEMDGEFFAALRHADELGPWEPKTQQAVLFVSLAAWDKLDPGQRRAVAAMVERGGVHNALKVFEIVKSYRRFDLICGVNSYDVVAGAECRRAGADASKNGGRR
ncbi:MAG: hypothetical protein JSS40_00410 [Proteobacteria bacterium]|nr:hypothetical protein [Pseudomonadota bacterium]